MKFRERKKSTRGRIELARTRACCLPALRSTGYTGFARKEAKRSADRRAAPGSGWEMHKKGSASTAAALKIHEHALRHILPIVQYRKNG